MSAKRLRDFLKNEELDENSVTRDSAAGTGISYCTNSNAVDWYTGIGEPRYRERLPFCLESMDG